MKLKQILATAFAVIVSSCALMPSAHAYKSITANSCPYPTSTTFVECGTGKWGTTRYTSLPSWCPEDENMIDWDTLTEEDCEYCWENKAKFVVFAECSSCKFYNTTCSQGITNKAGVYAYLCSTTCLSKWNSEIAAGDNTLNHVVGHDKATISNGDLQFTVESYGRNCSTHTAYASRKHYYNNPYGYLGTSRTFKGYTLDINSVDEVSVTYSVTGATATDYIVANNTVNLSITNNSGIDLWLTLNSEEPVLISANATSHSFKMPATDSVISIEFAKYPQKVTVSNKTINATYNTTNIRINPTVTAA